MAKKEAQLLIRLTQDELEQIQMNARACDKTTSAYIREIATNMCVLRINHDCVTEHTNAISSFRNAINQLIFTIKKTGNYTPVDLEYILDKTNAILQSEKEFLGQYLQYWAKSEKWVKSTVRKTVRSAMENKGQNPAKKK